MTVLRCKFCKKIQFEGECVCADCHKKRVAYLKETVDGAKAEAVKKC